MIGAVLAGRYEIVELLGQGSHGLVHRAVERATGREVAVKTMLAAMSASSAALERFTREAALVRELQHPNTVRLLDFGTSGDAAMPFMVFELLRGPTLEQEIHGRPMLPARAATIAVQILRSLSEAHARGIVHRDVKPSNIALLDAGGDVVKVLDFGVARGLPGPGRGLTREGQIMGTAGYLAPEQIRGEHVDARSDLFAVGILVAEMVAGRKVYAGESDIHIFLQQGAPEPVPIPDVVAFSPLGEVALRATQKDPAERYESSEAMIDAIARIRF